MKNVSNINKVCIFCGEKPTNKNKEHVIPQWLIDFTGDKKRPFSLFLYDQTKGYSKNENTSFNQFVFPACEKCNSNYSKLESDASIVVRSILNEEALNSDDFFILLDWLDKVRVGMWLAIRYRDNNAFNVDPNFYITKELEDLIDL